MRTRLSDGRGKILYSSHGILLGNSFSILAQPLTVDESVGTGILPSEPLEK